MSDISWKQKFGNNVTGYDPVEAQGLSELGHALKHNQISQDEYLEWARAVYETCSLDMKFFQEVLPKRSLFEKLKEAYSWSQECMPVGEWDEHLIIAGLEKPSDLPAEFKPIFLLAPLQGLQTYWDVYQSDAPIEAESENPSEETSGMPDGLAAENPNHALTGLSFAGITLQPAAVASAPPPAATTKPAAGVASTKTTAATQTPLKPTALAKPATPDLKAPLPPLPKVSEVKLETPAAPAESLSLSIDVDAKDAAKAAVKPPPPPKEVEEPEVRAIPISLPVDPIVSISEDTVAPDLKSQLQQALIEPALEAPISIPEAQAQEALDHAKKIYENRVFIEFDPRAKTATTRYWPQDFVATERPTAHDLNKDSFLAVVAKTQKPYHGYLIKNPIVEKFFREVNHGEIPENITVIPIVKNDEVVGAIAGWGPKTTYNLTVLRDMQKVTNNLILALGWTPAEAA